MASLKSLQVLLLAGNQVTEVSALAGFDSLQSVDLTGNPLSESAQARIAALRERGVTVEFTAPEAEDSVDVVLPEGPVLGDQQLLFSSNRRIEGDYLRGLEVHSLDLGDRRGREPVLRPHRPAEVGRLVPRLPGSPLLHAPERAAGRSPDGTRIAFSSIRDRNLEIYVMDADGGNPVNLTRDPAADRGPAWSPDGQRIAFERSGGGGGGRRSSS